MTLRLSNIRYAKLIRKMAVMSVLLLAGATALSLMCWCAEATGLNRRPGEAENSIPSLQGLAALKEHRLNDSWRTALNAARIRRDYYSVVAPLVIDEQKLIASDGLPGDEFGLSVAISGSTIVVGAAGNVLGNLSQDSAYVFERRGGSWIETQKLTASDGAAAGFGFSIAISGSTIVVGAPFDRIKGNLPQGSAYVFERRGGSWIETQKLTASDGAVGDEFGLSVACSGSTILVGAPFDTIGDNFGQGSAHVFNRQGGSWTETQKLTASDGAFIDNFGASVRISDATFVVGAPLDTIGANFAQGSAYVFNLQGGSWIETQKLTAGDGVAVAQFGRSIAFSGSTIVVGATTDTIGSNFDQGSAYVFNRQGESWTEAQKLTASGAAAGAQFSRSIALSGSIIVLGAPFEPLGANSQGATYIFNRQGGSWAETQKLTASDGAVSHSFGFSVALNGSTIVVGTPLARIGFNSFQGAAYVFEPWRRIR